MKTAQSGKRKTDRRNRAWVGGPASPSGSTLTEVLMSILAMSIGLVAIASLFPAAVLRSINATRLTRGTIHRHNAEGMVDLLAGGYEFRGTPVPAWGLVEGGLVHDPDLDNNVREHFQGAIVAGNRFNGNYIVDPLGSFDIDTVPVGQFGNGGTNFLPRYRGGFRPAAGFGTLFSRTQAQNLVSSQDSWIPQFQNEIPVTGFTATSVDLSTDVSAADLQNVNVGTPPSRVALLDATGKVSHARIITNIAGNTLSWTQPVNGFTPTSVRIETLERQFTWLLTVRNRGEIRGAPHDILKANVDVVVYHNRPFALSDEQVFTVQRSGRDYIVQVPGPQRPYLKKGGYLCDVVNARWYRIQRISNETSATPRIRLEANPPAGEVLTEVVFQRGVIEVYPLGTK